MHGLFIFSIARPYQTYQSSSVNSLFCVVYENSCCDAKFSEIGVFGSFFKCFLFFNYLSNMVTEFFSWICIRVALIVYEAMYHNRRFEHKLTIWEISVFSTIIGSHLGRNLDLWICPKMPVASHADSNITWWLPVGLLPWLVSLLAHWGLDKMAAFSQTTSLNAFSWIEIYECRIKFHWNLFLRDLTIFQHWFR